MSDGITITVTYENDGVVASYAQKISLESLSYNVISTQTVVAGAAGEAWCRVDNALCELQAERKKNG